MQHIIGVVMMHTISMVSVARVTDRQARLAQLDRAHTALMSRDWTLARALLDDMLRCPGVYEYLCAPQAYCAPLFVADRINAWNALVAKAGY